MVTDAFDTLGLPVVVVIVDADDDGATELVGVVLDEGVELFVVGIVWLDTGADPDEWAVGTTVPDPEKPQPAIKNKAVGASVNRVTLRMGLTSLNAPITPEGYRRLR